MVYLKKYPQKDFPTKELEDAIEMEEHLACFLKALSESIRNGEVKYRCQLFSKVDHRHEQKIKHFARHVGIPLESINELLNAHKIDPDAYSITGMFNEALLFEKKKMEDYQYLINHSQGLYRIFFKKLLKDSQEENKFLIREFSFCKKNRTHESKELDSIPSIVEYLYSNL